MAIDKYSVGLGLFLILSSTLIIGFLYLDTHMTDKEINNREEFCKNEGALLIYYDILQISKCIYVENNTIVKERYFQKIGEDYYFNSE